MSRVTRSGGFVVAALLSASVLSAQSEFSGRRMLDRERNRATMSPDSMYLRLEYSPGTGRGWSQNGRRVSMSELAGLSRDQLNGAGSNVRFRTRCRLSRERRLGASR